MNISDVQNIVEIAIAGKSASKFYEENKSFDIAVRIPEDKRNSLETISNIFVPTKEGMNIPLSQIADIKMIEGPVQISRQDGIRRIGIEMNITGRDIGSFVEEAKEKIKEHVKLPSGYYLFWGGQFENQQRAMNKLMIIAPIVSWINNFTAIRYFPFHAINNVSHFQLAICSNRWYHSTIYFRTLFIRFRHLLDLLYYFGVAVLNGVVLVFSHINQLREEGLPLSEAIERGSMDRLRPVLMTAFITIFSLIPAIISTGAGSEVQKPLAVVVVGGLITSTLLTLLIIPSIYSWFEKRKVEAEM